MESLLFSSNGGADFAAFIFIAGFNSCAIGVIVAASLFFSRYFTAVSASSQVSPDMNLYGRIMKW